MRKIFTSLILFSLLTVLSSSPLYASKGLIKPSSGLYFLQTWEEQIELFFNRSSEQKLNYLLELTERRVDEMVDSPSPAVTDRYENHYLQLSQLTSEMQNRHQVTERIRETSLRQQEILGQVYNQVPESAKEAIINAQENSSKHVERTVAAVEGSQKAQEYIKRVERIQQLEKVGQLERLEPVPMEISPNADPSQSTPQELRETNQLKEGQELRPLNPALDNQGGSGGGRMEPAQPIQMNQPAGQN